MSLSREAGWRPLPVLLACLLLLVVVVYADDDQSGRGAGDERGGSVGPSAVQTQVSLGQLTGSLPRPRQRTAVRAAARTVNRWFDASHADGPYPRGEFRDSFPGFTPPARRLAADRAVVTTNVRFGERIDGVRVRDRAVRVDLLARGGRLSGATARVRYVFDTTGEVRRRVRITGRLVLTPSADREGWRIFAFDLAKRARSI